MNVIVFTFAAILGLASIGIILGIILSEEDNDDRR